MPPDSARSVVPPAAMCCALGAREVTFDKLVHEDDAWRIAVLVGPEDRRLATLVPDALSRRR